jgi:hypothetical protein
MEMHYKHEIETLQKLQEETVKKLEASQNLYEETVKKREENVQSEPSLWLVSSKKKKERKNKWIEV